MVAPMQHSGFPRKAVAMEPRPAQSKALTKISNCTPNWGGAAANDSNTSARKIDFQRPLAVAIGYGATRADSGAGVGLEPRLVPGDMAVLADPENRADFSCSLTLDKPGLGFDLRFHSAFRATVPVKFRASAGRSLQAAMRVPPATIDQGSSVLFAHRFAIPDIPVGTKGEVIFAGGFEIGLDGIGSTG